MPKKKQIVGCIIIRICSSAKMIQLKFSFSPVLAMLTHTLIPRYLGRNIRVSSVKRNVTALDTQRNPKNRIQTRKIFYVFNSLWNLYGPRKKKSTPFEPGNTEVRYTRDNVWVRVGHENGTILIGITEQAKVRSHPYFSTFNISQTVVNTF